MYSMTLTMGEETRKRELGHWRDNAVEEYSATRNRLINANALYSWTLVLKDNDETLYKHTSTEG